MAKDFISSLSSVDSYTDRVSSLVLWGVELLDAQCYIRTYRATCEYWRDMDIDTLSVLTKTIDANGRTFDLDLSQTILVLT
jgi:hypothetical protein